MNADNRHLLSEHHVSFAAIASPRKFLLIVGGTVLAAGLFLLAWEAGDEEPIFVGVGCFLVACGLLWLLPLLLAYVWSIKQVKVYEEGLAWARGGREQFHSWDDVREVFRAEKPVYRWWRQVEMTVVFKKQESVILQQSLSEFFQLAALVEAIVTERLLPTYRQALDQEAGARFGPVTLKRHGIGINGSDFSWEEIEEYAICNGGLVVTPFAYEDFTGEFVRFGEIPNYLVLLRLLEELNKRPAEAYRSVFLAGRRVANESSGGAGVISPPGD